MDTAPDRPSPPDTSAVSEAAIGRLAALAGLDLAVGATWRCETRDPWTAETVRAALAAGAPQGAAILSRAGGRARAVEALWLADGRPLIRAAGAPDGSPVGPVEQAARAVRFCDGAATRLGVGRGAVAVLLDSATGAAIGAALPVAWLGEGWRPAGPLVGARLAMTPPRLSAAAARFGWSVLVAAPAEGGSLAVALPPAPGGGALLEMLYALDDAAASQGCGLRLEARWTPPDARLRRAVLRACGRTVALTLEPTTTGLAQDPAVWALVSAVLAAGAKPRALDMTLGDGPGGARTLAARPDAVARLVADWLARPGLGRGLSRPDWCAASRLDGRGPAAAADLARALAAACGEGPDPLGLRLRGLSRALSGSELGLAVTEEASARLVWRDLAPPEDFVEWSATALALTALIARAAVSTEAPSPPADIAAPRDLFALPNPMWRDMAGALADLAAAGAPTPTRPLREALERRYPTLGQVDGAGFRLTATVAAEAAPGVMRAQALLEGGAAATAALLVEGRPAPLARCPLTGGRLCGLRWQAAPAPRGWTPTLEPRAAIRLDVVDAATGRGLLGAILDLTADPPRLIRAEPRDGPPPGPARPSPFQPATVDLRDGP